MVRPLFVVSGTNYNRGQYSRVYREVPSVSHLHLQCAETLQHLMMDTAMGGTISEINNTTRVTMTILRLLPWQHCVCYHDNTASVTMTTPRLLPWQNHVCYHDKTACVTMTTPHLLPWQHPPTRTRPGQCSLFLWLPAWLICSWYWAVALVTVICSLVISPRFSDIFSSYIP